jgi:hypothetical protein
MDTKRSLDDEFPRPLPHPRFFGWATVMGLAGVALWNLRLGEGQAAAGVITMILFVLPGLMRRKKPGSQSSSLTRMFL